MRYRGPDNVRVTEDSDGFPRIRRGVSRQPVDDASLDLQHQLATRQSKTAAELIEDLPFGKRIQFAKRETGPIPKVHFNERLVNLDLKPQMLGERRRGLNRAFQGTRNNRVHL